MYCLPTDENLKNLHAECTYCGKAAPATRFNYLLAWESLICPDCGSLGPKLSKINSDIFGYRFDPKTDKK